MEAGVPASEFLPVVCDLTKEAEVQALPRIVAKRWPGSGIDVLVNNAGACVVWLAWRAAVGWGGGWQGGGAGLPSGVACSAQLNIPF